MREARYLRDHGESKKEKQPFSAWFYLATYGVGLGATILRGIMILTVRNEKAIKKQSRIERFSPEENLIQRTHNPCTGQ